MSALVDTLAVLAGAFFGQPAVEADPCATFVSPALAKVIGTRFPGYQLPVVGDNLPVDAEYEREHGGDGCLGADRGDYNGDGLDDIALLLSTRDVSDDEVRVIVVAALSDGTGWQLSVLRDWGRSARERLYVATAPPGHYQRTESLPDPPDEPGEVETIESALVGVTTGVTESSQLVYFLTGCCWNHVWVSD